MKSLAVVHKAWNKSDEAVRWRAKLPQLKDVEEQN
jgi:hypothetical protein